MKQNKLSERFNEEISQTTDKKDGVEQLMTSLNEDSITRSWMIDTTLLDDQRKSIRMMYLYSWIVNFNFLISL
jgi:hypothetical protein